MTLRTRIAAAATAATLAFAGAAGAEGYFVPPDAIEIDKTYVKIDTMNLPADGIVAVYAYTGAEFGEMLGSEAVTEGVNTDLRISFSQPAVDRIALVYLSSAEDDPATAEGWMEIDVENGRILPSSD